MAKDDPLWKKAVQQKFLMDMWPYNQGTVPANCTEKYWPTSWTMIQEHQRKIQAYQTPKRTTFYQNEARTLAAALLVLVLGF
jgi:hypothetical protein